jgi:TolA-binding protein
MKRVLPIVLAVLIAAPVATTLASPADAQVRVGSGAQPRTPPRPRPRLSEAERERLEAAQDEVAELDDKIAALEESNTAAGGLTEAQRQEWQSHATRRQTAQATVERLEAKRRG